MKTLLKLFGPVLFVVILVTVVDVSRLAQIAASVRPAMALLAVFLFFPLIIIQTFRWWLVCRQLNLSVAFFNLFEIYYISWFLGSLPLSGATAASKALYLKREGAALDRSAASVMIDKFLDLTGIMAFAVFSLTYLPHQRLAELLSGWIYLAAGAAMAVVLLKTGVVKRLWLQIERFSVRRFGKKAPDLPSLLADFRQNTGIGMRLTHLLLIVVIGLLRGTILFVLALCLGLDVSFWLMVACRSLVGLVNIVPISISGLGTREAVLLLILPLWGITTESAVALGFLAFVWTVLTKLSGVVFWLKHHH